MTSIHILAIQHLKLEYRCLLSNQGWYVTIHITPEPECSYVSFETNFPLSNYHELIGRLLKIFGPQKFLMTIFANEVCFMIYHLKSLNPIESRKLKYAHLLSCQVSEAVNNHRDFKSATFTGFMRHEYQFCRLKNYDLTYALFAKAPS